MNAKMGPLGVGEAMTQGMGVQDGEAEVDVRRGFWGVLCCR